MTKLDEIYKLCKCLALLIPSIISLALLSLVLFRFNGTMTNMNILEAKLDSMLGIIGVAVSVWIGLNIYNVIERNEVAKMQQKIVDMESKLETIENKLPEIEKKAEESKPYVFA